MWSSIKSNQQVNQINLTSNTFMYLWVVCFINHGDARVSLVLVPVLEESDGDSRRSSRGENDGDLVDEDGDCCVRLAHAHGPQPAARGVLLVSNAEMFRAISYVEHKRLNLPLQQLQARDRP